MKTSIITLLFVIGYLNAYNQSFSKEEIIYKNKKEKHKGIEGLWEITQTTIFTDTLTKTKIEEIENPYKMYYYIYSFNNEINVCCFSSNLFNISNSLKISNTSNLYDISLEEVNQKKLPINIINKKEFSYEYYYFTGGENEKAKSYYKGKRIKNF